MMQTTLSTPPATLYMLQIQLNLTALLRFLASQGHVSSKDADLGYGVHAWLTATFGELAPRPFRCFLAGAPPRKSFKLLGYTPYRREQLLEHAALYAGPAARAVCDLDTQLALAAMPGPDILRAGKRVGFEAIVCPLARQISDGVEIDFFLHQASYAHPDAELDRAQSYAEWLAFYCQPGARLESSRLARFQLVSVMRRRGRPGRGPRPRVSLTRPAALLQGEMIIQDGDQFQALLARGIGRHRAFGFGMLLLKPR